MGDRRRQALRVPFAGKLKLEFHGAKITSDVGLPAFRELGGAFRVRGSFRLTRWSLCVGWPTSDGSETPKPRSLEDASAYENSE